jgi:precorrin-6Y C5,15-methyltransferase (decarboxylating)
MTRLYVIGIGYRPLDKKASEAVHRSDIILANNSLLAVFREYKEYVDVKEKIKVLADVHETIAFIRSELLTADSKLHSISLLASGDPMFFGIGRVMIDEFGKDAVEILPDLSSIQVAFAKIKEPWHGAFLMSVHGGPDPAKRRKLEYELTDIPALLEKYDKIAILTDKINNPAIIAKTLFDSSALPRFRSSVFKIFVCEKLGYMDEHIFTGTPEDIAACSFAYPNVVIIKKENIIHDSK